MLGAAELSVESGAFDTWRSASENARAVSTQVANFGGFDPGGFDPGGFDPGFELRTSTQVSNFGGEVAGEGFPFWG